MSSTCITGVIDDQDPFVWLYLTIDCDTSEPAAAFAVAGLGNGDCGNPQSPECWDTSPLTLEAGRTKRLEVRTDDLTEEQVDLARSRGKQLAEEDPSFQFFE